MNSDLTQRQKIVLAALAAEQDVTFAPIQVQKLFFLMDENISEDLGDQLFAFEPYDYGPFDKDVYHELDTLKESGLVTIENPHSRGGRRYGLTISGQEVGTEALNRLDEATAKYILELSEWVRSLGFAALVGAIYKAYPKMKENSIFTG